MVLLHRFRRPAREAAGGPGPVPTAGHRVLVGRRIAAYATFEFLVGLGVSRTVAFDLAWRWFAR